MQSKSENLAQILGYQTGAVTASAAPRHTDAAVDVPEKDISTSSDIALRSMEGQREREARKWKESGGAEELGGWRAFL